MVYLEQLYKRLLNPVENHYEQYYNEPNTTSLISKCGSFSLFLSLDVLRYVLPSNFSVSGVKSSW